MKKKIVIFYHTRVFAYLFRKKKNEIYCILEVIYIYIIYMLYYTHTFYHNRVWYHGIDLHENDVHFWSVCVCTHIFFVWQHQSPAVWESFLTSVVQGGMWRSADRTNNRNKAFAQQHHYQPLLQLLRLIYFTPWYVGCSLAQVVVNMADATFVIM